MTCNERPIFLGDLELSRFTCNGSLKIEPSVATNLSLTGTGSTANPLVVVISSDAGNKVTLGGDGGLFVPPETVFTDATIDGDGSGGDPLSVPVSTDADNLLSLGTDSKHFLDCAGAHGSCSINDLGDVNLALTTANFDSMLVVDMVSGDVAVVDMTTAVDCAFFTGT